MTVSKLIRDFSARTKLPVDVDDIVAELKSRGVKDDIWYYWDTELDPSVMGGHIKHYKVPVGDLTRNVADITYGKMGNEKERLVCGKELLHILDPERFKTNTEEGLDHLIEKMRMPPDVVDIVSDGVHALTDRFALTQALTVMFPLTARNALKPFYDSKKLSLLYIADLAELPPRYVGVIMSDAWDQIYADCLTITDQLNGT